MARRAEFPNVVGVKDASNSSTRPLERVAGDDLRELQQLR